MDSLTSWPSHLQLGSSLARATRRFFAGINPFLFDDGKLSIIAERTPAQHLGVLYGQQYTSGAIATELSHQQGAVVVAP